MTTEITHLNVNATADGANVIQRALSHRRTNRNNHLTIIDIGEMSECSYRVTVPRDPHSMPVFERAGSGEFVAFDAVRLDDYILVFTSAGQPVAGLLHTDVIE